LQLSCIHILQYGFNKLFIVFKFLMLKAEKSAEWSPTGSNNSTVEAVAQAEAHTRTCTPAEFAHAMVHL